MRVLESWLAVQVSDPQEQAGALSVWLSVSVMVAIIVAVGSWLPVTSVFFQLDAKAALLSYAPAGILGVLIGQGVRMGRVSTRTYLVLSLPGEFLLQFFTACLVVFSSVNGGAVFASLLVFTAVFHGYYHRSGFPHPLNAIGTAVAVSAAFVVRPSLEHLPILGIAGFASVIGSVTMGGIALRADAQRKENQKLREAVAAGVLEQRAREVASLADRVMEMSGANHDAASSVMAALITAERLSTRLDPSTTNALDRQELGTMVASLVAPLQHLRQLIEHSRAVATGNAAIGLEPVNVPLAIDEAVGIVSPRFQEVRIETVVPRDVEVVVAGGAASLVRCLDNLLTNGCEGDGESRAASVRIAARASPDGRALEIIVEDDGPGFREEVLALVGGPLTTTKPGGSGLGLLTVRRLVQASGGTLECCNRKEGGATLTLRLRLADSGAPSVYADA